jgi:hypothetical protein
MRFSQRIQLDWLEYTTNLLLAGNSKDEIVGALRERLWDRLSGGRNPKRGNREKAVSILTKVWVTVPKEFRTLRDEGLQLVQRLPANDRLLVHWCMCMATYPFFAIVAEATGRLLQLQGTTAAAHVQRRVRERLGERETVSRATRRILRAFADWGVLLETGEKGIYRGANKRHVENTQLATWAIKTIIVAKGAKSQSLSGALRGPHLFPFDVVVPTINELERCGAFEVTRHGLDHEILLGFSETSSA